MNLERLNSLLDYNKDTGLFTWKLNRRGYRGIKMGDIAGTIGKHGHIYITVDGKRNLAHRVAWSIVKGLIEDSIEVDHINGVASDNRISNLRLATHKQNQENRGVHKKNTSGFRGVSFDSGRSCWVAKICHNKKQINLGRFSTAEDANDAAVLARKKMYTHDDGRDQK